MVELLIVVPTYNERESLTGVIDRISAAMPNADILVVDDSSPDGTGNIADSGSESDSDCGGDNSESQSFDSSDSNCGNSNSSAFRRWADSARFYISNS